MIRMKWKGRRMFRQVCCSKCRREYAYDTERRDPVLSPHVCIRCAWVTSRAISWLPSPLFFAHAHINLLPLGAWPRVLCCVQSTVLLSWVVFFERVGASCALARDECVCVRVCHGCRPQQALVLCTRGGRELVGRRMWPAAAPPARLPTRYHGQGSGRDAALSAHWRTIRPDPGAGPTADYLLVVPKRRAGYMYVLVIVEDGRRCSSLRNTQHRLL